jgi:hypothetical protein
MKRPRIIPTYSHIRSLPTLRVFTEKDESQWMRLAIPAQSGPIKFRLELKLEYERERYWVCSHFEGSATDEFVNWKPGAVVEEHYGERYQVIHAYDDSRENFGRALDYINVLARDLGRLLLLKFSHDTQRSIDEIRLDMAKLIIAHPDLARTVANPMWREIWGLDGPPLHAGRYLEEEYSDDPVES